MGRHRTNKSLKQQVKERLDEKLAIGKSKYAAKLNGTHTDFIFSWNTYKSYLKHNCYFVQWAKEQPTDPALGHKPRTVEECRMFAESWIQYGIDRNLSAYTLKLQLSSLAKLYGCKTTDFNIQTPPRKRKNIKRSRGDAVRDKHFSVTANKDMITFCKCTGLRRSELMQITGADLIYVDGIPHLNITKGTKGGRPRISVLAGSPEEIETVKSLCIAAGKEKIFPNPSENADIHSFRAVYVKRVYDANKCDEHNLKDERLIIYKNQIFDSYIAKGGRRNVKKYTHLYTNDKDGNRKMLNGYRDVSAIYYSRIDRKGEMFSRRALFIASAALGHSREHIIVESYLH